ncbi:MAG: hypothetical protein ACLQMO_01300 [Acidobacteriaceae bacterium]
MAPVPERLATIETTLHHIKRILWISLLPILGWGGYITVNVITLRQAVADSGTKLVAELKAPKSTQQLQANLIAVTAQIQTARVEGKKPNPQKIKALSGAVATAVQENPELDEGWRAAALLASYRTSDLLKNPSALPDCDINQKAHAVLASEVREIPGAGGGMGYLFKNCRLYLDKLPPGKPIKTSFGPGHTDYIGNYAFVINCEIVLTDSGIAESSIVTFVTFNCRFDYQIEHKPPPFSQQFLLTSLEARDPGQISLSLRTQNSSG